MVRPGQARRSQVRSGQAMQGYLDLKIHVQHSACHTEATYQTSCRSVHRAQSNHRRYTNRLRAFNHFRYLPVETGISKRFKVPAIFGTLNGDIFFTHDLCQILLIFEEARSINKGVFFTLTFKDQKSFSGHGTFMTYTYIDGWTLNTIAVVVLAV